MNGGALIELQYYGIDWVAMVFTFWAIYLIGNKNRTGFVIMILGNAAWVVVGVLTDSLAMIIANGAFIAVNARAWLKWTREARA